MSCRLDKLVEGETYHIYTRGIEKRKTFMDDHDRLRFQALLSHCLPRTSITSFSIAQRLKQQTEPVAENEGLVNILCFCLMPNHFHLLLRQNYEQGISIYMHRLLTSYARYFNVKNKRSGSLFINPYKALLIDDDDYLLHVSRYIHLNPYVTRLTNDPFTYPWSSAKDYLRYKSCQTISHRSKIRNLMTIKEHKSFVNDEADYARSLFDSQHLLIDYEL